jgi:hypothetical protein
MGDGLNPKDLPGKQASFLVVFIRITLILPSFIMKRGAICMVFILAVSNAQTCEDTILNNTGIGEKSYVFLPANDIGECCAACANETRCVAWVLKPDKQKGACGLKEVDVGTRNTNKGTTSGIKKKNPTPPPTPTPPPAPVPAGSQKNIVFILVRSKNEPCLACATLTRSPFACSPAAPSDR